MIIDAHLHLGNDRVFDEKTTEEEIIKTIDNHGIDEAIVQPMVDTPSIDVARNCHDRIARMAEDNPGRIFGMVSLNPHLKEEEFEKEIDRCIKELEFVGIKLNPLAHACNPLSKDGMRLFEKARELEVPVMVHTGAGIPFSLPAMVIPIAKKFLDLKIILAHGGNNITAGEALVVAEQCDNVFLEPSWVAIHIVCKFIKSLGASRIMFGSDMLENCPVELAKYRNMRLSREELEQCLWKTAKEVFNLSVSP